MLRLELSGSVGLLLGEDVVVAKVLSSASAEEVEKTDR